MARSKAAPPEAEQTLEQSHKQTIKLLKKDLKQAAKDLAAHEVRYLVDLYYQIQQYRMRAANQQRAALTPAEQEAADALKAEGIDATPEEAHEPEKPSVEPNALVSWVYEEFEEIEALIQVGHGLLHAFLDARSVVQVARRDRPGPLRGAHGAHRHREGTDRRTHLVVRRAQPDREVG